MRKILYILSLSLLVFTCDDGDIIDVSLDFEDNLTLCNQVSTSYLLYKTKSDPYESLSLVFPVSTANNQIFNPPTNNFERELVVNQGSIRFNYRTYNGNPDDLICELVPDQGVGIVNDYEAVSGALVEFLSTYVDDDNDGIPSILENQDPNGDGNFDDAQDTDGDGLPDYIDQDDDNDNVLTSAENPNYNETDGLALAQDTDGDGTPDYLDDDDDNDGVITRYEDENGNSSPLDDFDEMSPTVPNIARYLDPTATQEYVIDDLINTQFTRTVKVEVKIINANLGILSDTQIEFGTYTNSINFLVEN